MSDEPEQDAENPEEQLAGYVPDLRAFFRMRLGPRIRNRENESDLVQSVFREVLQDMSAFRGGDPSAMRRWLFVTASRKIKDRNKFYGRARRAAEREAYALDDQESSSYIDLLTPSRIAIARERVVEFEQAFDALPEDQRLVVTSAKILGLSCREIAEDMGRTEGAVRMLLNRALARIGLLLEKSQRAM